MLKGLAENLTVKPDWNMTYFDMIDSFFLFRYMQNTTFTLINFIYFFILLFSFIFTIQRLFHSLKVKQSLRISIVVIHRFFL